MALERQIRSKRQRSAVCRQAAAADAEQRPALLAEAEALARSAHRIGSKMRRIRDLYHAAVMRLVVPKDVQRPVVVIPYYHRAARSGLPARTRLLMGALGARVRARTRMTRGWRHGHGGFVRARHGAAVARTRVCVCVCLCARESQGGPLHVDGHARPRPPLASGARAPPPPARRHAAAVRAHPRPSAAPGRCGLPCFRALQHEGKSRPSLVRGVVLARTQCVLVLCVAPAHRWGTVARGTVRALFARVPRPPTGVDQARGRGSSVWGCGALV